MTWVFVLIAFTASSITAKEPTGPDGHPACSKTTSAGSPAGLHHDLTPGNKSGPYAVT